LNVDSCASGKLAETITKDNRWYHIVGGTYNTYWVNRATVNTPNGAPPCP
jgi:hypothetical protein